MTPEPASSESAAQPPSETQAAATKPAASFTPLEAFLHRVGRGIVQSYIPHLATYALALVWAVAGIVPSIFLIGPTRLLAMNEHDGSMLVVRYTGFFALAAFALGHVAIVPILLFPGEGPMPKPMKRFFVVAALIFLAGLLTAAISWIYLMLFYGPKR
jgi:hypothetical protein